MWRVLVLLLLTTPAFGQSVPVALDGDTARYRRVVYRYFGVDAGETQNFICPDGPRRDRERAAGERAKARNQELLNEGARFTGITTDKYGRRLAVVVHRPSGRSIADILIMEGLGVPYFGEARTCRF